MLINGIGIKIMDNQEVNTDQQHKTVVNVVRESHWSLHLVELLAKLSIGKIIVLFFMMVAGIFVWETKDVIFDYAVRAIHVKLTEMANKSHDTAIADVIKKQKAITIFLNQLSDEIKPARMAMFEFHNGLSNIAGLPFIKMDETAEVVAPSISSVRMSNQNLPIDTILPWLPVFLKHDCVIANKQNSGPFMEEAMTRAGTDTIIACPIFIPNRVEPLGYVSAVWTTNWDKSNMISAVPKLQAAAKEIGIILQAFIEVN
jgi:hypothetical protein